MADLAITSRDGNGVITATVATATASDTLTYVKNVNMTVSLDNTTAGSLTINIVGTAPSNSYPVAGTASTMDLTTGFNVTVPAGVKKYLNLDKISAYLNGTGVVTLSGAAGLKITVYK